MSALDNQQVAIAGFAEKKQVLRRAFTLNKEVAAKLSLQKDTSNLFRKKKAHKTLSIDLRHFNAVLYVDPVNLVAEAEGMATYETIVQATLQHDTLPCVVPQLKSITIGGALAGLGIESSSFIYGLVHESIIEIEILLGDGNIVVCTAENEFRDLFLAFPNSYGSLGYALRVKFKLIPVKKGIKLTHQKYDSPKAYFAAFENQCRNRRALHSDHPIDYIDGVIFSPTELYITTGIFVDHLPYTSNYQFMQIYYQSIKLRKEDFLTTEQYIWRWDADWFWCSHVFGMHNKFLRFLFGKWMLHSAVYAKILRFFQRQTYLEKRLMHQQEAVIQDILIPSQLACHFFTFLQENVRIFPIWICPTYSSTETYTLCPLQNNMLYLDFGIWGRVNSHFEDGYYNRLIEQKTVDMQGFKSLYSTCYYTEKEFWSIYNQKVYDSLKAKYDAKQAFLSLYEKCCQRA